MATSVRLTPKIESSLVEYCECTGLNKSQVISNAISYYIANDRTYSTSRTGANSVMSPSPIYKSFQKSGLIGALSLLDSDQSGTKQSATNQSATKERVRRIALSRLTNKTSSVKK